MSENRKVDYLIIGQGLAGSFLSYFLLQKGKTVLVLDDNDPTSSSRVAAGIMHPITGRRIVLSWMSDVLIPFAEIFYQEMETLLGKNFFHQTGSLEIIQHAKQWNDWSSRMADPGIRKYIDLEMKESLYLGAIHDFMKLIFIRSTSWVDIPILVNSFREWLHEKNCLQTENFNYDNLKIFEQEIQYNNIKAGRIIFCEGSRCAKNPLWNWVPFKPAKGEILTIKAPELPGERILFKGIFIIPMGHGKFRVGATNSWDEQDSTPTERALEELTGQLKDFLSVPFTVIDHKAGIRPTVLDRRPLIGPHPKYKNVFLFNGLGTKGILLAPYFANEFAGVLENNGTINAETDINRFYSFFAKSRKPVE